MTVLRFPSGEGSADQSRYFIDVTETLAWLRYLLEAGYDLDEVAANPKAVDDAETVAAILALHVIEDAAS